MPISTMTSKGQTTVPKEVRDVLDLGPGDKLTSEVNTGRVAVDANVFVSFFIDRMTRERPRSFFCFGAAGIVILTRGILR